MATATSTSKLYKTVVEDVINNVKEAFLDEGVDEQVLQELKQLWEQKLSASKALEPAPAETEMLLPGGTQQLVFPQHQMLATGVQQRFPGLPIQLSQAGTELSGAAATATMALPRGIFHQQMAQLTSGGTINGPTITLANGQVLVPQLAPRGQTPTTSINIPQTATLVSSQLQPGITMQQIRPVGQVRTVNPNMVQTQHLHGMRQVTTNPTNQSERMAQPNQNPHAPPPQHPMGNHGPRHPSSSQSHHLSNPSQHANQSSVNPSSLNLSGQPQPNHGQSQSQVLSQHQGHSQQQGKQGQVQHQGTSQQQGKQGQLQHQGPSQHQLSGQLLHHGQPQHPGSLQGQPQHPNQGPTHQHPNQYLQHPNQPPHSTQSQHIQSQSGHLTHFPNQHQRPHLIPSSQHQQQQQHLSQQHQQHPMQHQLPPSHITNPPYPRHPMHPSHPHLLPPNQQQRMPPAQLQPNTSVSQQMYGMPSRPRNSNQVLQLDGAGDTSSSDDDDLDDDDNDDNENENENEEEQGEEEEPLNTDDDISEEDPNDLFDTDNVVVCQYDKINRNKNKWKFHLKDGIMNLRGKDYVFQKANGEAEW